MATCPKCNGQISDTAKFCKHCGNKIEQKPAFVFCEECGAKIEANAPFCEECGAKVGGAIGDTLGSLIIGGSITGLIAKITGKDNKEEVETEEREY